MDFSGQYSHRNQLLMQPFIPGLLDQLDGYNQEPASATMPRIQKQTYTGTGLLTCCPSTTLLRLALGPTNPGMIIMAQETSLFRWAGFSPALWLLIPAFSLDNAPPDLAIRLQRRYLRSSTAPQGHIPQIFLYLHALAGDFGGHLL